MISSTVAFRAVHSASSWRSSQSACAFFSEVSNKPLTACSDFRANSARSAKEPPPSMSRRRTKMSCVARAEESERPVTVSSNLCAEDVRPAKELTIGCSVSIISVLVTVVVWNVVSVDVVFSRIKSSAADVEAVVVARSLSSASLVSRRSKVSASSVSDRSVVTSARRVPRVYTSDSRNLSSC